MRSIKRFLNPRCLTPMGERTMKVCTDDPLETFRFVSLADYQELHRALRYERMSLDRATARIKEYVKKEKEIAHSKV